MCDLKTAINKCKINFDKRILVTDLINEYDISFEKVQNILEEYVNEEEKGGLKFEKQFIVFGEDRSKNHKIYTIANSANKLNEWLHKLRNAEWSLYSVQIAGCARVPAQGLKPVQHTSIKINSLEKRNNKYIGNVNGENRDTKVNIAATFTSRACAINSNEDRKETKLKTPEHEKPVKTTVASDQEVGFTNLYTPGRKSANNIGGNAKRSQKPQTPKKMDYFFQKKDKISPNKEIKSEYEGQDEINEKGDLTICQPNISDNEEKDTQINTSGKRCHRLDSDDEGTDEPHKIEKIDVNLQEIDVNEGVAKEPSISEKYLDDEGFLVTVKLRNSSDTTKKQTKASSATGKISKKSPMKSISIKTQPPSKTKQGTIMGFFTKK